MHGGWQDVHACKAMSHACTEGEGAMHGKRNVRAVHPQRLTGLCMHGGWWVVHAWREKDPCIPGGRRAVMLILV